LDYLLEALLASAKDGGEILKKGFYGSKNVEFKGEVDLVTEYDRAVEVCVVQSLSRLLPSLRIIGEEGAVVNPQGKLTAYVDPIDGTTNFVHGIPHTAVSIGVWDGSIPIAGVVYNPILDELFYAKIGYGAFCNGSKIAVSTTDNLTKTLVATGFPYTKTERGEDLKFVLDNLAKILPITRDVRRLGSASLDLCYTAKGIFDAYYEINLKPWDYAAGAIILMEAGGKVVNERLEGLNMQERLIIASNSAIFDKFILALYK